MVAAEGLSHGELGDVMTIRTEKREEVLSLTSISPNRKLLRFRYPIWRLFFYFVLKKSCSFKAAAGKERGGSCVGWEPCPQVVMGTSVGLAPGPGEQC
jgi:hypothetical protein